MEKVSSLLSAKLEDVGSGFVEKFVGSIPSYHSDLPWTDVEASRGELGSEDQEYRRLMLLRRSSVVDVGERIVPGLSQ